jgi:hypothetical protein
MRQPLRMLKPSRPPQVPLHDCAALLVVSMLELVHCTIACAAATTSNISYLAGQALTGMLTVGCAVPLCVPLQPWPSLTSRPETAPTTKDTTSSRGWWCRCLVSLGHGQHQHRYIFVCRWALVWQVHAGSTLSYMVPDADDSWLYSN